MGMEAIAIGSLLGGGAAVFGASEARKGRKNAEREAGYQREAQARQEGIIAKEQERLSGLEKDARKKLNAGIARGARRRIRGGLFGDSEATPGTLNATLG